MILWLDDIRDPDNCGLLGCPGVLWVKTYEEAVDALNNNLFTFASLDHDLGACAECEAANKHIGDMKTPSTTFYNFCTHAKNGYDFVTYMEQNNRWPSRGVKVHSMNPVGKQRMEQVIANHYGRNF